MDAQVGSNHQMDGYFDVIVSIITPGMRIFISLWMIRRDITIERKINLGGWALLWEQV
jgi:hypothetical protein